MQKRTPFNVISFLKTPYGLMISKQALPFPQLMCKSLNLRHISVEALTMQHMAFLCHMHPLGICTFASCIC